MVFMSKILLKKFHLLTALFSLGIFCGMLYPIMNATANDAPKLDYSIKYITAPPAPKAQTWAEADKKSVGCMTCHTQTDRHTMHANPGVVLGCSDCHGGNADIRLPKVNSVVVLKDDSTYRLIMDKAHILPRDKHFWAYPKSANPADSYARLNKESPEFIRFVNPGDLRIAREACGACHLPIIQEIGRAHV